MIAPPQATPHAQRAGVRPWVWAQSTVHPAPLPGFAIARLTL